MKEIDSEMDARRIALSITAGAALVALIAVSCLNNIQSSSKKDSHSVLLSSDKVRAAQRLQKLHFEISSREGKESVSGLRSQLLDLEGNLKSELQSVKLLLSRLGDNVPEKVATAESTVRPQTAEDDVIDKEYAKKTMQQGAMRGESVETQLRKVLDHDLEKLILHNTNWKSKEDLDNAVHFADYLKDHPLQENSASSSLRGHSVATDSQLALKSSVPAAVSRQPMTSQPQVDGGILVQAVDTAPQYFRDAGAVPNGVEGAEYAQVGFRFGGSPPRKLTPAHV